MSDVDDLKAWSQIAGESAKAYHAFIGHFLALPIWQRSMAAAYTDHLNKCKGQNLLKKAHCPSEWNDWRFRFSWLERAAAYDAELVERDRLIRLADIDAMNKRHQQLAIALQNTVVERLQVMAKTKEVVSMSPVVMARVLDRASIVERRARDVATSITKTEGDAEHVVLDLSRLDETELAVFEKLVAKAEPGQKVEVS